VVLKRSLPDDGTGKGADEFEHEVSCHSFSPPFPSITISPPHTRTHTLTHARTHAHTHTQ
jgi:hypothetical protein